MTGRAEQDRKYRAQPHVKERERVRQSTPEYKEAQRKRDREYRQRPDVKKREQARKSTPAYKAAQRERDRKRQSDPAYLAKQRGRYDRKLPLERLTRLEAIRAVIDHYCFGKVNVLHSEACPHINQGTFYRYVNSADVHISGETDASINTAIAKWLIGRGYLTGAAKEFRDLMDSDAIEAWVEAIRS